MNERTLGVLRRAFAKQVLAIAGVAADTRLEAAFGRVRRERFLGTDPWTIVRNDGVLVRVPANDPVYAYQNALFAISPSRGVNNGEPSLHARLLHALAPEPGQTIVHLGAGTGYYSAILAALVGRSGRVTAVEIDPYLAAMAKANLADVRNAEVVVGDGASWPRTEVDRIYTNYGVSAPAEPWITALAAGGRLVLPLGVPAAPIRPGGPSFAQQGGAFLIARQDSSFTAKYLGGAFFVHAEGTDAERDPQALARLSDAFHSGKAALVRSLVWKGTIEARRCWYWSPEWALSYDLP